MKKVLMVLVVIGIIASVAYFGTKSINESQVVTTAEILPQNVAFYYSVQNIDDIWNNIKSSLFWKEFSTLSLWKDLQISTGISDLQKQFKENIGVELTEANVMNLAGGELAVAIIPGNEQAAPPKVLLLCKGKDKKAQAKIAEDIVGTVKKTDASRVTNSQYKGLDITHIKGATSDQPDIYLLSIESILVIGIGDTLLNVQEVADLSKGTSSKSLATVENFKNITSLMQDQKKLAGLFYIDFSIMKNFLQGFQLPGPDGTTNQINPSGLDAIKYMGGWSELKEGLVSKIYIYPNLESLDPSLKKIWETAPMKPSSMKFIPEQSILHFVTTSIDLSDMWNVWQNNLKTQAPEQAQVVLDAISTFQTNWNVNVEADLIPLVKNEIAFIFSDIITQGIVPLPKLALALEINDKKKASDIIASLVTKNNENAMSEKTDTETPTEDEITEPSLNLTTQITLTPSQYEGYDITSLQLPLLTPGLAPGYTYIDDFLVLGASTKTLQDMIDVKKGKKKSIREDSMYKQMTNDMPQENNQQSYINITRLMDLGVGICNWIISFQQLSMPQNPPDDPAQLEAFNARKAQAEATISTIKDNVIPLLKSLKVVKGIATTSVNKKAYLEQTVVLNIKDN